MGMQEKLRALIKQKEGYLETLPTNTKMFLLQFISATAPASSKLLLSQSKNTFTTFNDYTDKYDFYAIILGMSQK